MLAEFGFSESPSHSAMKHGGSIRWISLECVLPSLVGKSHNEGPTSNSNHPDESGAWRGIFTATHIQVMPTASVSTKDRTFGKNMKECLSDANKYYRHSVTFFQREEMHILVSLHTGDYTILQYWSRRKSIGHIQLHAEVLLRNLQSPSNSGSSSLLSCYYTRYP